MYQDDLLAHKNILNDWASSITLPKQSGDVQIYSDFTRVGLYQHHREYQKQKTQIYCKQNLYSNEIGHNHMACFNSNIRRKVIKRNNVRFRK